MTIRPSSHLGSSRDTQGRTNGYLLNYRLGKINKPCPAHPFPFHNPENSVRPAAKMLGGYSPWWCSLVLAPSLCIQLGLRSRALTICSRAGVLNISRRFILLKYLAIRDMHFWGQNQISGPLGCRFHQHCSFFGRRADFGLPATTTEGRTTRRFGLIHRVALLVNRKYAPATEAKTRFP